VIAPPLAEVGGVLEDGPPAGEVEVSAGVDVEQAGRDKMINKRKLVTVTMATDILLILFIFMSSPH
jgi:hypothetical protein